MKTIRFFPPSAAVAVNAAQQIRLRHTAAAQNRFIESSALLAIEPPVLPPTPPPVKRRTIDKGHWTIDKSVMPKPQPAPPDPAQIPALARAVLQNDRFPVLATVEGNQ